jgi:multidrug efflux system membrane fusion protein
VALLVIALLGYGGYRWIEKRKADDAAAAAKKKAQPPPRVPVVAVASRKTDMPVYLTGLGSVTAYNTVTVKTRVDGQIVQIFFKEGDTVKEGDALIEIDPRPYQVQLLQAQGQLARDQSQLTNAKADLDRYQSLSDKGIIARQQRDTQAALVGQYEGGIKADEAAIESAKLQLTYCHITAPIGGRIGLRLVDIGNIAHASDPTGLLVITQLQPIAALFTIPEDNLPSVMKPLAAGQRLTAEAFNRDGTTKIASGYLLTVDNQIDQSTGTSRLKAIFPNEDSVLFPNQFVNVRLQLGANRGVVAMPVAALQRGPQGTFVYVVKQDQSVELRMVKPGLTQGSDMSVDSGLSAGELVVVEGADKLQQGTKVDLRQGQPAASRKPAV